MQYHALASAYLGEYMLTCLYVSAHVRGAGFLRVQGDRMQKRLLTREQSRRQFNPTKTNWIATNSGNAFTCATSQNATNHLILSACLFLTQSVTEKSAVSLLPRIVQTLTAGRRCGASRTDAGTSPCFCVLCMYMFFNALRMPYVYPNMSQHVHILDTHRCKSFQFIVKGVRYLATVHRVYELDRHNSTCMIQMYLRVRVRKTA